jgi:hypothetical protein
LSRTSRGFLAHLGRRENLLTQGLASKVFIPPPPAGGDTQLIQAHGWVNVARSRALWDSVLVATKSLATRPPWVDEPSAGIPYLYVSTGLELSQIPRSKTTHQGPTACFKRRAASPTTCA